ncbi:MAG: hypothetical protein GYB68_02655 [Chloroflexi bacterium]|nr:hypothetical protein [Chloroflexota bacterium]
MTEYIDIDIEPSDHPDVMQMISNLDLTPNGEREVYRSPQEGDEGSPIAQTLFMIPGLAALELEGDTLTLTRQPEVEWHDLIEDVSDALRDFFL